MPAMNRRGVTLLELVAALALFGVIAAAAFSTLLVNQRTHAALRQQMDLQQNLRAAATLLPAELRELNAADGDIVAMSATSLSMRAMRRMAFVCSPPTLGAGLTGLVMTVRLQPFFGSRTFAANDSLLIAYEGDQELRTDDTWVFGKVVSTASLACPDGRAGQRMTVDVNLNGAANAAGAITVGAPVRGFERLRYFAYQNTSGDNKHYLGLQNASGTQPLIGPLTGSSGLSLAYYDAAGAATAVPANVATIGVTLRGMSARSVRRSNGALAVLTDSVVTRIALRNNRRF